MHIEVNTDANIEGREELRAHVESVLQGVLGRFGTQITRIEVHFTDESGPGKSGADDKRCLLEARLAGLKPIAVSHYSATVRQALDGAADKMEKTLDRTLSRLGRKGV
jgi:ribosome-associated translation inhibitor RaiA